MRRSGLAELGKITRPKSSSMSILMLLSLSAIFAIALIVRTTPAQYGFYLNEFDPYFDYYATDFIVKNVDLYGPAGALNYFTWVDHSTWYPEGRPVASSSQVGLHFAGAGLYLFVKAILGAPISLYDFLVLFPVIFGALTTIIVFLLIRRIAGTSAGLFASLIIAVSPPIILRGTLGWFKSEPLALFLALLGIYLYLTVYGPKVSNRGLAIRSIAGGLILGYAYTAWGGTQYFSIVFGLVFLASPFLNIDLKKTVTAGAFFVASALTVAAGFPRPGPNIIAGAAGMLLLAPLGFAYLALIVKRFTEPKSYSRTLVKMLFAFALIVGVALSSGAVSGLSGRYLTVIYPYLRSDNPLVESVAEHFVPTGQDYLASSFALIFLAGFGAILLLRKRDLNSAFLLFFAITGVYVSASFSRLMVFSALAFAFLGAVGLSELLKAVIKPSTATVVRRKTGRASERSEAKVFFSAVMIVLLAFPVFYPPQGNWLDSSDVPVSIASSSLGFRTQIPDWLEALKWIRENTPSDAVMAAWWDYGYWITVMGNRTTLADNATINQTRIAQLGKMFMSNEKNASKIIGSLGAKYIVVFMGGIRVQDQATGRSFIIWVVPGSGQPVGGDEAKKQWFIRIGGLNLDSFVESDGLTPKQMFWNSTLLGRMFPVKVVGYVGQDGRFKQNYEENTIVAFECSVKYPTDLNVGPDCPVSPESQFLKLVYASPSTFDNSGRVVAAVLIYQVVGEPSA
ncbi:MAG: hypothetical protein HYU39_07290 [Thaumarchaeota archaeon]|nr:hypothetical protein [Nitrososphaerota archaeon]